MKNTSRYAFEDDGRLWTQFNGGLRRPSTVEEMEGYCRERDGALHFTPVLNHDEDFPMAMAV
jgi:hypothetical protein